MGVLFPRKNNPQAMEPEELALEKLVTAIVGQAAKDFRRACSVLSRWPDSIRANEQMKEVSSFFRSEWFTVLTGMDGREVLEQLQDEYPDVFRKPKELRSGGRRAGPDEEAEDQTGNGRRGA